MPKLTLIRGLPGSGKSTLAKALKQRYGYRHYEADMYFVDKQGRYTFDAAKLGQAHGWCFYQTKRALAGGHSVVVSNTFVKKWEMKRFLKLCEEKGYELEILICRGNYPSIHNVPEETLLSMREQWQE